MHYFYCLSLCLAIVMSASGCVVETRVGDGSCGGCAADCDHDETNGCETDLSTVENCGACRHACSAREICLAGTTCWNPDDALIGAWTFEEASGSAVSDVSLGALDGNVCSFQTDTAMCTDDGNGPIRGSGHNGRGLIFDGVDDGVFVPFSSTLHPTFISMEAWINWSGNLADWQQRVIEHTRAASSSTVSNYSMTITPEGGVQVEMRLHDVEGDGAVEKFETRIVLNAFEWTHLIVTYDGQRIVVYKDGTKVDDHAVLGQLLYPETTSSGLGIGNQTNRNRPFYGTLDDVRIYNRALTAIEVAARYNFTR